MHGDVDKYEIYALKYATLAGFKVSSLVAGADPARQLDIAMMFWVLKGIDGRIAIIDCGFHREQYFRQELVQTLAYIGLGVEDFNQGKNASAGRALSDGRVTTSCLCEVRR